MHNTRDMSAVVRVILVDDHPPVREGLRAALEQTKTIEVVGEAETAGELENMLYNVSFEVLVLDLSLPDRSGIDMLYMIRDRFPSIKIIVLSMHNRSDYILEALQAGALGYMTKETASAKLIEGIAKVEEGSYFFDKPALETIVKKALENPHRYYDVEDKLYENLTAREQEIMRLLAEGFSVRRIAGTLSISFRTVENYRSSLFRKLKVNNLAELVHYAKKLGIIDFD